MPASTPQKLHRKRVLGSGPYGALRASYTPDDECLVTQFKVGEGAKAAVIWY